MTTAVYIKDTLLKYVVPIKPFVQHWYFSGTQNPQITSNLFRKYFLVLCQWKNLVGNNLDIIVNFLEHDIRNIESFTNCHKLHCN